MLIVSLIGSPRQGGNSAVLATRLGETARRRGARTESFFLNQLSYRGCQACLACKTSSDRCVLEDDLTEVLEAVRNADVLVLATPVYFGEVTSQMKAFLDRAFSFLVPDYFTNPHKSRLQPGKKLVFIQCQGDPDEKSHSDIYPRYESFFRWYGFEENHLIRACGKMEPGSVEEDSELLDRVEKTAELLFG
jgi:multimeric flavodoxin WrbA